MSGLARRTLEKMALDRFHQVKKRHNDLLERQLRKCKTDSERDELIAFHDEIIDRSWNDYLAVKNLTKVNERICTEREKIDLLRRMEK